VKDLTLNEGALLAGLTKGPTYFSPDRQPNRARERLGYVLNRMREDGMPGPEAHAEGTGPSLPPLPVIIANARPRRDIGFHFIERGAPAVSTLTREGATAIRRLIGTSMVNRLMGSSDGAAVSRLLAAAANQSSALAITFTSQLSPSWLVSSVWVVD
jgi:hypothetical protein